MFARLNPPSTDAVQELSSDLRSFFGAFAGLESVEDEAVAHDSERPSEAVEFLSMSVRTRFGEIPSIAREKARRRWSPDQFFSNFHGGVIFLYIKFCLIYAIIFFLS